MRFSKRASAYAVIVALMLGAACDAFAGQVTFFPTTLNFGGVFIHTSSTQSVVLTNKQITPLSISRIVSSSSSFVENNNCPSVLNAFTSCAISVTFTPNEQRNFHAQL